MVSSGVFRAQRNGLFRELRLSEVTHAAFSREMRVLASDVMKTEGVSTRPLEKTNLASP